MECRYRTLRRNRRIPYPGKNILSNLIDMLPLARRIIRDAFPNGFWKNRREIQDVMAWSTSVHIIWKRKFHDESCESSCLRSRTGIENPFRVQESDLIRSASNQISPMIGCWEWLSISVTDPDFQLPTFPYRSSCLDSLSRFNFQGYLPPKKSFGYKSID